MAALLPCQGGRAQAGCRTGVGIQGLLPTHSKTPAQSLCPPGQWAQYSSLRAVVGVR